MRKTTMPDAADTASQTRVTRSLTGSTKLSPATLRRSTECMAQRSSVRLHELARLSGLSPGYFSRAFKCCTGVGPRRWHLGEKIRRAQHMLLDTDLPLAEVALECGFADQSHFTHVFRKITGAPPGSWRKQQTAERDVHATPSGETI
jgi:AraC family transcriptional regulator